MLDYCFKFGRTLACSAVVIALRFATLVLGSNQACQSMLHASSWLLNEAKSFFSNLAGPAAGQRQGWGRAEVQQSKGENAEERRQQG